MKLLHLIACLIAANTSISAAPIDPGTPSTSGPGAATNFGASGGMGETGLGNPIAGENGGIGGTGSSGVGVVGADPGGITTGSGSESDSEKDSEGGSEEESEGNSEGGSGGSELASHPMTEPLPDEHLDELNRPVFTEYEGGMSTNSPPPLALEGGDGRGASVHCPRRMPPQMFPVTCAPTADEGMMWMIPAITIAEPQLIGAAFCQSIIGLLYEGVEGAEDKPELVGVLVGEHDQPDVGKDIVTLVYPERVGLSPSAPIAWK